MEFFSTGSSLGRLFGAALLLALTSLILLVPFAESYALVNDVHCEDGCDSDCECDRCFAMSPMTVAIIMDDPIPVLQLSWSPQSFADTFEQVWLGGIDHPPNSLQ